MQWVIPSPADLIQISQNSFSGHCLKLIFSIILLCRSESQFRVDSVARSITRGTVLCDQCVSEVKSSAVFNCVVPVSRERLFFFWKERMQKWKMGCKNSLMHLHKLGFVFFLSHRLFSRRSRSMHQSFWDTGKISQWPLVEGDRAFTRFHFH